jgi:hypothetical protein
MLPRHVRALALLFPLTPLACGDDGNASTAATTTGITSATTPGTSAGPGTGEPTTTAGGGSETGATTTGGASVSDSDGTTGTGSVKLDLGMPDFGSGSDEGCKYIDVLFIVDISASMGEEKANLDANFPDFVAVLDAYVNDPQKGALGYRLGVTNSSIVNNKDGQSTMGLDGALFNGDNIFGDDCDLMGNLWIDGPGPAVTDTFSCLAPNPKSSCQSCTDIGKERPLDTIEMFIDKAAPGGVNDGFYRGDESLFVVVILTDEDDDADNTTTTPTQTKMKLDNFTGGEERYVIVTVAGPQNMSCDSAFGSAAPAPTLHQFTGLAPNGLMGDICQGDLTQALDQALALIQQSCDTLPPPVG